MELVGDLEYCQFTQETMLGFCLNDKIHKASPDIRRQLHRVEVEVALSRRIFWNGGELLDFTDFRSFDDKTAHQCRLVLSMALLEARIAKILLLPALLSCCAR